MGTVVNVTRRSDGLPERVTALEALLWDDLFFPPATLNLPGAPAAPAVDDTNFYGALLFSGSQDNDIALACQMPHSWANNTAIVPHLHVVNTGGNGGSTTWELYMRRADVGESFGAYTLQQTLAWVPATSNTLHQLASFVPIDMAGYGDSSMLYFWIRRKGTTDANTGIITLLQVDIHYQTDKRGSINEIGER